MAIDSFFVTPVTVQTAWTVEDRYGQDAAYWEAATETETAGWLQDLTGIETLGGRDTLVSTHLLYLPATVTISGTDRVVIDGRTYEVDGPPRTARTPEGAHHIEVGLRLIEAN